MPECPEIQDAEWYMLTENYGLKAVIHDIQKEEVNKVLISYNVNKPLPNDTEGDYSGPAIK